MMHSNGKAVLNMSNAQEVSWCDKPRLHNAVEKLSVTLGIPKPKIFVAPGEMPDALATCDGLDTASITVSEGFLKTLFNEHREPLLRRELIALKKCHA